MSITAELDRVLLKLAQSRGDMPETERILGQSLELLKAQSYGGEGGGLRPWCWEHQQDVADCHRQDRLCTGQHMPNGSDPVGETVAEHAELLKDLRDISRHVEELQRVARSIRYLQRKYADTKLTPATADELADENKPRCEECARFGWDAYARGKSPTRVEHKGKWLLTTARWLCRWHEDVVRETGSLPLGPQVDIHARKVRLRLISTKKRRR